MATSRIIQSLSDIVTTTDATLTTLATITVPTGGVATINLLVTGKTSTPAGAGWAMAATFKNAAGTVAQVGATLTTLSVQDAALITAAPSLDVTGATFRVRVTGVALTTIEWYATGTVQVN